MACNCSTPGHADKDSNCQVFDFMVGALFFNGPSNFFGDNPSSFQNASDIAVLRLMRRYSVAEINSMSYTIRWIYVCVAAVERA